MSGINREIFLDPRHVPKHLPNTPQSQRLLQRGRSTHIFNDEDTMLRVAQAIIQMQSPPYMLLLLGDKMKGCYVFDPAEHYGLVKAFQDYEEAQLWLLEDEYEPLEGRLSSSEIQEST
jgi:hypothetical protein